MDILKTLTHTRVFIRQINAIQGMQPDPRLMGLIEIYKGVYEGCRNFSKFITASWIISWQPFSAFVALIQESEKGIWNLSYHLKFRPFLSHQVKSYPLLSSQLIYGLLFSSFGLKTQLSRVPTKILTDLLNPFSTGFCFLLQILYEIANVLICSEIQSLSSKFLPRNKLYLLRLP